MTELTEEQFYYKKKADMMEVIALPLGLLLFLYLTLGFFIFGDYIEQYGWLYVIMGFVLLFLFAYFALTSDAIRMKYKLSHNDYEIDN